MRLKNSGRKNCCAARTNWCSVWRSSSDWNPVFPALDFAGNWSMQQIQTGLFLIYISIFEEKCHLVPWCNSQSQNFRDRRLFLSRKMRGVHVHLSIYPWLLFSSCCGVAFHFNLKVLVLARTRCRVKEEPYVLKHNGTRVVASGRSSVQFAKCRQTWGILFSARIYKTLLFPTYTDPCQIPGEGKEKFTSK